MLTADPIAILDRCLRDAIASAMGPEFDDVDPLIRASQNPQFGDYQANFAMSLAKRVGEQPRAVAQRVIDALDLSEVAEPPEVAGPGFINIRLRPDALGGLLDAMDDEALGVHPDADAHTIAIDLCGVNVAKQMHVGHLRSTIIGDAIARVYERLGRTVYRENHLGDWGLPIAMTIHALREAGVDLDALDLDDLNRAYRDAQLATKADARGIEAARRHGCGPHRLAELEAQNEGAAEALEAAKQTLLLLQQGDASVLTDWQKLIDCTMRAVYASFDMMNVKLGPENNRGESFYRDRLPHVVADFESSGHAEVDDGALIVRFADRERPLLIRKSDGGFLYATTDLAALRYRVQELNATRVIYLVDARQRDHFRDVFDGARLIGWDVTPDGAKAEYVHLPFGAVLGKDKKPLKTRSGDNFTLEALLLAAIDRGTAEVERRASDPNAPTHGLPAESLRAIGQAVGIGAVKYADLSNDLVRDYVFDLDRMVAFEGNTGPYIQYAHARICSIFARAEIDPASVRSGALRIEDPAEKQLSLTLLRYPEVIAGVASSLELHRLCTYLYDLANAYSAFYQACPVLKADSDALRDSRLRLCDLARRVLADGLDLLGIEAPTRM